MRAENYQLLMENNAVLAHEQVQEMKHIIEKYPYCQSAYLPLLKYYYTQNHIDFEELLKLTAVYSSDRNQVRKYLMKEVKPVIIESQKEETKEEQKVVLDDNIMETMEPLHHLEQ